MIVVSTAELVRARAMFPLQPGLVAKCCPALLGQMRHHGMKQPDHDAGGLSHRPAVIGHWRDFELPIRFPNALANS